MPGAAAYRLTYRRRLQNTGFKAGNVRDFCERWGHDHPFALTLDADSLMTAVRSCASCGSCRSTRKLGILQSLVIGMPSTSAFARIFQFGMRPGMRSYTIGSAWWQGDCGPYLGAQRARPASRPSSSIANARAPARVRSAAQSSATTRSKRC